MPIFRLTDELVFPSPDLAETGLLAVGGDLSEARVLLAYRMGIFPWYVEGSPKLWWSPDPRLVLLPEDAIRVVTEMDKDSVVPRRLTKRSPAQDGPHGGRGGPRGCRNPDP